MSSDSDTLTDGSSLNFSAEDDSENEGESIKTVAMRRHPWITSLLDRVGFGDDDDDDDEETNVYLHATGHQAAVAKKRLQSVFRPGIFVKETMYNILMFACLPIGLVLDGYTGMRNRGYIGLHPFTALSLVFSFVTYTPVITYIVHPSEEISILEVIFPVTNMFLLAIIIGVKYAFTPKREYEEINEPSVSNFKRSIRRMILTGWAVSPFVVVAKQIAIAGIRADVDLHSLVFHHNNSSKSTDVVFSDLKEKKGTYVTDKTVSLKTIATQIQLLSRNKSSPKWAVGAGFVVGLVAGLIPSFVRASQGLPFFGSAKTTQLIAIAAFLGTFLHVMRYVLFMIVCVVDMQRRMIAYKFVGELISRGLVMHSKKTKKRENNREVSDGGSDDEESDGDSHHAHRFKIDLTIHGNLTTWYSLRRLINFYGLPMYNRIQLLVGVTMLAELIYVGLVVVAVFDPNWPVDLTGFYYITYQILVLSSLSIVALVFGARANRAGITHVTYLNDSKINILANNRNVTDANELARFRELCFTHDTIIKAVETDQEIYPVKFLGVKASIAVLQTLMSLAVAGVSAGVRGIIYQTNELEN